MHKFTVYLEDTRIEISADHMTPYDGTIEFYLRAGVDSDTIALIANGMIAFREDADIRAFDLVTDEQYLPPLLPKPKP